MYPADHQTRKNTGAMETIYTDKHHLRDPKTELFGGELVSPFECPARAEHILARIKSEQLGPVSAPDDFGLGSIQAIHDAEYVAFLQSVWDEWTAAGFKGEALPTSWPVRRSSTRCPSFIDGKLGYFAMAGETAISNGTWEAAYASAQTALTGAARLHNGASSAFSLCRPPGHHAAFDMYGGYCFLNNAAISAQACLDHGATRVAILDVDFHHGNGTQDIFYERDDVLFASLHGEPDDSFPYYWGYAHETGQGRGEGFNLNLPLSKGTSFETWHAALGVALTRIREYQPDALIVSLGVDTFEADPISYFKLSSDDFKRYGADIACLGVPTLFVMEGGYAVAEIGVNTVNVLAGFAE